MKKCGRMWVIDSENYFDRIFNMTYDDFELSHLRKSLTFVEDRGVAYDCGANYGSWTRLLARGFAEVHAFEPRKDIFECLLKNTTEFNNVFTHNCAVGEVTKKISICKGEDVFDNSGCSAVTEGMMLI